MDRRKKYRKKVFNKDREEDEKERINYRKYSREGKK